MSDPNQSFTHHEHDHANRLQRLVDHVRGTIPAVGAHHATSSFTLQREPVPQEATGQVAVVVFPQDPFVGEPEIRLMDRADISPGLINNRVQVEDSSAPPALPNQDGHYLYYPGTPEFDQVNAFYYVTLTLRMFERYARRAIPWPFPSPRIAVDPHAGAEANAYYNERERSLGFHTFPMDGKHVSTAQSADIVSHETAHAVLDGLRDLFNESFGLGPSSFHESFGDMAAVLVALHDDSLLRRLLHITGGDLRLENFVSTIAEYLGVEAITDPELPQRTGYIRNALNAFQLQPFDTLPYLPQVPEIELGRQSHNYSRLFTGAFYDILVGVYEHLRKTTHTHLALHRARDVVGGLLIYAVEVGPVGEMDFHDMALAFLAADHLLYEGLYRDILIDVFAARRAFAPASAYHDFAHHLERLPVLRLPEALNNALASALFLEQEIFPALSLTPDDELIPLSVHRNASGVAFVTYFSARRIPLEGDQYGVFNGAKVDLFGGLSLSFDAEDRLRTVMYRPIRDEDVRQVRLMLADMIAQGVIADATPALAQAFQPPSDKPPLLGMMVLHNDDRLIVKSPIKVDRVQRIPDILEHLHRLLRRL